MKIYRPGRSLLVLPAVAVFTVLLFFLPVEVPYSITAPGKIMPAKEWILSRGTDGRIMSTTSDHLSGVTSGYSVSQFERGDAVSFQLRPGLSCGLHVQAFDTVAFINSNEVERDLNELKGDLEAARASLEFNISGEKEAIISQETGNLDLMRKQAEEQLKIYRRIEALYHRNLASKEEYEVARGTAELNEINIKIAEARLKTVQTGAKPEQLEIINSQISSLTREIGLMQKKMGSYTLISPIDGIINRTASVDTLLIVSETLDYIVLLPVKWDYRNYTAQGQRLMIEIPGVSVPAEAEIVNIDNKVSFLNGSQVFLTTALIRKNHSQLAGGILARCEIECGKITLLEFVSRLLKTII